MRTEALRCRGVVSLLAIAVFFPTLAGAENVRIVPSGFDAVESLEVPYRASVPEGEWRPSDNIWLLNRSPLRSDSEQRRRIDRYRPLPVESPDGSGEQRRRASLAAAALYEIVEDWTAARYAYLRVIALGGDDFQTWRALARVALLDGDPGLSEAAQFAALERLRDSTDAIAFVELRAEVNRDLAALYMLEGRTHDAALALELAQGLATPSPNVQAWLTRAAFPVAFAPISRKYPDPLVWPKQPPVNLTDRFFRLSDALYGALPLSVRKQLVRAVEWSELGSRRDVILTSGFGLLGLMLLLRLIRQRGDLIIAVEYPEELRGVFRVRVITNKREEPAEPGGARVEILKGGPSTRYERHLVSRETQFNRLLSRRYWVIVEGMLLDPDSEEVLEDFADRKLVRVRHRRTVRLEFDAEPLTCPVDIRAAWHDKLAEDVAVAIVGRPETLSRAGRGELRLWLPKGSHRLVVASGDRVLEREIEVISHQPSMIEVDLAGEEVVFKGCPPAVEPYLEGHIEEVSRALELDGQADLAYRMLARHHAELEQPGRAADYFESAGDLSEAAAIWARECDYVRAAELFVRAEQPTRAAEMYRQAGDWVQAGRCYELARDFEQAVECYAEAQAVDLWLTALEHSGKVFKAAKLALKNDRRPRAMRLLQCIAPEDEDYAEASWLLTQAFEREGHFDLAAQQLEQHISTFHPGSAPAEKYSQLADLFEQSGSVERALEVLEDLRRREPAYPQVASRVELLKKQRSASDRSRALLTDPARLGEAPTAFVSESRYEILEELGRGGMGVVYRARDRRLDRVVALKRLPEDLRRHQPRAAQLFVREAQAAARLNHPHIVTVYDADQEDGHLFITMELLDGEPFNLILKERQVLSANHVMAVAWQVASALQYAHDQGVIHRDIKTANLFLTTEDTVKVMDFGLAKMLEEVRGGTTIISGTPFYMSPEQVMGGTVDRRTDLYSLGVTLFELATGRVPFAEGDVAYHHRHTPPPDPRTLASDLPDGLAELLLNLLEKDVEERCPSADGVLTQLVQLRRSESPPTE